MTKISVDKRTYEPLKSDDHPQKVQLYKRRWLILVLFALYSASSAFQWIQYSVISNIVSRFYGVEQTTINWLSMVYMLAFIPFQLPATWLLNKKGLRVIVIIGSTFNALGACLKIPAAQPNLFPLVMTAHVIASVAQVFILGMPSKFAATWFGPNEVSTACAISVFGDQVGVAMGFLLPPLIVPDAEDPAIVAAGLRWLFIATAAIGVAILILVLCLFEKQPPVPPSLAQLKSIQHQEDEVMSYAESIKLLLTKLPVVLLIISYGINTGLYYAIATLLNPEILTYYPANIKEAGQIGLTIVLVGFCGTIIGGIILDRTRAYKITTVAVYVMSTTSMLLYTFTLARGKLSIVYATAAALGFFMAGYLPVGFEFAAEISHPVSEGNSSGLLTLVAQIFGVIFTFAMEYMLTTSWGVLAANIFACAMLGLGIILTACIRSENKRQKANAGTP